jgi:hypothetical protein
LSALTVLVSLASTSTTNGTYTVWGDDGKVAPALEEHDTRASVQKSLTTATRLSIVWGNDFSELNLEYETEDMPGDSSSYLKMRYHVFDLSARIHVCRQGSIEEKVAQWN